MHRGHAGMGRQEPGDRQRVLAVPRHPQRQRLEPAQHQPALERPRDAAARGAPVAQQRAQRRVAGDDRAAQHVGVAGDRLGERVHRRHRAELERPLQQPGGDRVVHHERRVARRRDLAEGSQVGHLQQRVGGRLGPQHGWRRPQCRADRVEVELVDRHRVGAMRAQPARERPRVVVAAPGEYDATPARGQREHQRHRRRLAGRERHRGRARPLDVGQRRLDGRPARVGVPPVPALRIRLALRHIGAGDEHWRRQRGARVAICPRVDELRFRAEFHNPHCPERKVAPPIPPPHSPQGPRSSSPPSPSLPAVGLE